MIVDRLLAIRGMQVRSEMRSSEGPVQSPRDDVVWQGSVAVPAIGLVFALGGAVIGGVLGSVLVDAGVIQPGSSEKMGLAVVGVLGGAIAWFVSVLVCMIAFRNDGPPSREEAVVLVVVAVGFVCAGLLLVTEMPAFEDGWKDPRMFRLQRLIWLDVGLAASTCLVVAQRRLRPPGSVVLMTLIGLALLAVAIWQFVPFLAACAPIAGGDGCRTGF